MLTEPFPIVFRMKHERILRNLIYTTWNDSWYQADKAVKDWYSEFDEWFYSGFKDTKAYNIWQEGLIYLENNLDQYIQRDAQGRADGLTFFIKSYRVGPMKGK